MPIAALAKCSSAGLFAVADEFLCASSSARNHKLSSNVHTQEVVVRSLFQLAVAWSFEE
jgi:hypothetical protein